MLSTLRFSIYQLLNYHEEHPTAAARRTNSLLLTVVLVNVAAIILTSRRHPDAWYRPSLLVLEGLFFFVFLLEYLARVWSCVEAPRFRQPWLGRLHFLLTPLALLDLVVLLPRLLFAIPTRQVVVVAGALCILKVARYVKALHLIGEVVRRKRTELLAALGLIGMLLLLVASLMCALECAAQPDKFGSIPASMWWAIATLTTVGYGDVYPVTAAGKLLGGVSAILGLGLFAIPTGILASGFSEQFQERQAASATTCSQCAQLQAHLDKTQRELELLAAQLQTNHALLASRDEIISLLRGGYNRPN